MPKRVQIKTPPKPLIKPLEIKDLWLTSLCFGLFVFLNVCFYYYLTGDVLSLDMLNKSTATTAVIVMGASLALSGFGYFWDFLDKKVIYRKYLGLVGYFFVVWHALNSLYFYFLSGSTLRKFDIRNNWEILSFSVSNLTPFFLGLAALLIFTFMALISNKYATKKLGIWWRKALRLGYLALVFALIHFGVKNFSLWEIWVRGGFAILPPMSLLLSLYILLVLSLRLTLAFALKRKTRVPQKKNVTKSTRK